MYLVLCCTGDTACRSACDQIQLSVAIWGYKAFEMWLIQIQMCYKYEKHNRFQRLRVKKTLINNFDIDYMLKWYILYIGLNWKNIYVFLKDFFIFQ